MEEQVWTSVFGNRAEDLQDQWSLSMDNSIKPKQPRSQFYEYIRGSFARFHCSTCQRSWPSKRVLVVFHFSRHAENGRGTVKVRRFKQECRKCATGTMEEPQFDEENIDVMVEKLVEKILSRCYGMKEGDSYRRSVFKDRVNGPHESAHCEACKTGICQQGQ